MTNVIQFPATRCQDNHPQPVRWQVKCACGSLDFSVFACGEILCAACDDTPHNPGRGDVRAYWTEEAMPAADRPAQEA